MSEHDESLEALLQLEREAPGMPDDVAMRLAERFAVSLAPLAPTSPESPPASTNTASISTNATSTSLALRGLLGTTLFALGVGSGIFVDRTWLAPSPQATTNAPTALGPAIQVVAPPIVATDPVPEVTPSPLPQPTIVENVPSETDAPEAHRGDTERLWMERAESAFGRGDAHAALAALQAHRRHFPEGRMREERDALEVRALVLDGDANEAVRRAARFEATYPRSIFSRQIQASLRSAARSEESSTDSITAPQTPSNPTAVERTPRTP